MSERLDEKVNLRITRSDKDRLEKLSRRGVKPQTLARIALRIGLADLETNGEGFLRVIGAVE